MVDIHSHLLFGLDDGSPDLETSIKMAQIAVKDGITKVVCTPHASPQFPFSPEKIASHIANLRETLAGASIPLDLGIGCDFHMSVENLNSALSLPRRYTINATEYLLIELPDFGIPPQLGEIFYRMRLRGITPILTHPERNATLQRQPERLIPWLRGGLLMQVTANSLTGGMGKRAQEMSERFLRDRWVHVLATDSHNLSTRPPQLRAARERLAALCGEEYSILLCTENPEAIFAGRALPEQQAMRGLKNDRHNSEEPWWQRLTNSLLYRG